MNTRSPRILIVSSGLTRSMIAQISQALIEHQHQVEVLRPEDVQQFELHPGDALLVIGSTQKVTPPADLAEQFKALKRAEFNLGADDRPLKLEPFYMGVKSVRRQSRTPRKVTPTRAARS
jgi:hypothetical protein